MEAISKITANDGDFIGAFRQNVIRVIGNYGQTKEDDEYEKLIKEKEQQMVELIAENAKAGTYTEEFDKQYKQIADEITSIKNEQMETRRKRRLADNYEQRVKDMDNFLKHTSQGLPEFDDDLVRRLVENIKVVSVEWVLIQFKSGIVMEQGLINE